MSCNVSNYLTINSTHENYKAYLLSKLGDSSYTVKFINFTNFINII